MARKPRLRRLKTENIRLTPEDPKIVGYVMGRRLATTSNILGEFPHRSPKHLKARLRQLYDHDYLDRPLAQLHDFVGFGTPEIIHAVGNRGAELLAEINGTTAPRSNWTDKNRSKYRFLKHTLRIGDLDDAVNRTPRHLPWVNIITNEDILRAAPGRTRQNPKPWSLLTRIRLPDGSLRAVTTVPDKVFGLDNTEIRKRFFFFGECDRGTEPIIRIEQNTAQTSVGRKFQSYLAGYHAGLHKSRFNIGNIRFLFITTSQQRVQNMLGALAKIAGDKDYTMFLFADFSQLTEAKHIQDVPWINGRGDSAALFD